MADSSPSKVIADILKQARARATTGMNQLNRLVGDPSDAIAPILGSAKRIDSAVSCFESHAETMSEDQDALLNELDGVCEHLESYRERLENAQTAYLDGEDPKLSRKEMRHAISQIGKCIGALNRLRLQYVASTGEKRRHKIKQIGVYTGWIVLISGLFAGFAVALNHPDYDEGLNAHYFTRGHFRGHHFECIDHMVDNNWRGGAPFKGMPRNRFSVRWEGCVRIDTGTERQLVVGADDRIQLIVDGEMVVDDWAPHRFRYKRAPDVLKPGVYPIEVKYQDDKGGARVFLGWEGAKGKPVAIPPENLLPRNVLIGGGGSNRECPKMPPLRNKKAKSAPAKRAAVKRAAGK